MEKIFYVYILASTRNGTLYIGFTSNLARRVYEHKNGLIEGFSKKYNVHHLIFYEKFLFVDQALNREKRLKQWKRQWKIDLIEKFNPEWRDLYFDLIM